MNSQPALALAAILTLAGSAGAQTLVARYQLNEASGTLCADSSGNGLDGTYRGAFGLAQPSAGPSCASAVHFDAAALTDVIIPGAPPLDTLTSSLSVSAWINPDTLPATNAARRIFGNNNGGWTCGLNGDGLIFTTRFIQDYLLPGVGLNAGSWTHVAFVFDASYAVTFYVDGTNVGSIAGSAPANTPTPDWFIGGFNGSIEFWDGLLDDIQVYSGELTQAQVTALAATPCSSVGGSPGCGTPFCVAAVNATGGIGTLCATGSATASANDLTLTANGLPNGQFGIFIVSLTQGFVPGGSFSSNGNLCLGGVIGRFSGPGQILSTGQSGSFSLSVDTTQVPQGGAFATIMGGETWSFQAWHREGVGHGSNFTEGLEISFF